MAPDTPATERELQPAREERVISLEGVEWREAPFDGQGSLTVRGHAAIFNRASLDLGGFTERIAKGAFSKVLDGDPDVHALWDHDTARVLARTRNKTLELREDPAGLHFWAKVAPTSYAADLRVLMERGDVDQASFAFSVPKGGDSWEIDGEENVTRTIHEVDGLYDVTITAKGAYPQTDAGVVTSVRSLMKAAIESGLLPETAERAIPEDEAPAESEPPTESEPQVDDLDPEEERTAAPEDPVDGDSPHGDVDESERVVDGLRDLKAHTRVELELAKRRLLEAERK